MNDPRMVRFFTPEKCGPKPKPSIKGPTRQVRLKAIIEKKLSVVAHWDERIAVWAEMIDRAETERGKAMASVKDAKIELAEFEKYYKLVADQTQKLAIDELGMGKVCGKRAT